MKRRTFIAGSLLAGTAAAAALWRARLETAQAGGTRRLADEERTPDGRVFLRDVALAFGTTVSVAVVHDDAHAARTAIAAALGEVCRIDRLMTVYRPDSQVGQLNARGVLERPDPDLVRVLEFSQRLAALSGGAFDVTVQPLWRLFSSRQREGRLPSAGEVAEARRLVDWTTLEVSPRRVALGRPGMAITLNGVAQGYAADLSLAALQARGIRDALVDCGEMGAEGMRQPGCPWTLGIQHPRRPREVIAAVAMDGRFLATSGDYATPFSADFTHHHVFERASAPDERPRTEAIFDLGTLRAGATLLRPDLGRAASVVGDHRIAAGGEQIDLQGRAQRAGAVGRPGPEPGRIEGASLGGHLEAPGRDGPRDDLRDAAERVVAVQRRATARDDLDPLDAEGRHRAPVDPAAEGSRAPGSTSRQVNAS